jgi:WD40 repeat protein
MGTSQIEWVAWSPNGNLIAAAEVRGDITICNVLTGANVMAIPYQATANMDFAHPCFAWSPKGNRIASSGNNNTLVIWDATSGRKIFRFIGHGSSGVRYVYSVKGVAWKPDGHEIASISTNRTLTIWNAMTGSKLLTLQCSVPIGNGASNLVAWSPCGRKLAFPDIDGESLSILDRSTLQDFGNRSYEDRHQYSLCCVAWSPKGDRVASGSGDYRIIIWDAVTGRKTRQLKYLSCFMKGVAWNPKGDRIVSAGEHRDVSKLTEIIVWEAASGAVLSRLSGHTYNYAFCVAWSPDGRRIASADDSLVRVWAPAESGAGLAVAMGLHPRLGRASPLAALDHELIRFVGPRAEARHLGRKGFARPDARPCRVWSPRKRALGGALAKRWRACMPLRARLRGSRLGGWWWR